MTIGQGGYFDCCKNFANCVWRTSFVDYTAS
jgi:hypothetical protein